MVSIHSNYKECDIIIADALGRTKLTYPSAELIWENKGVFY